MTTITICVGSSCHLKGSHQYIDYVKFLINKHSLQNKIILAGSFCMERCLHGVNVKLNNDYYSFNELDEFKSFIDRYFKNNLGVEL